MKIHPVNFMIAVAVSALVAYGLWSIDGPLKNFVAVGSFVFFAGTLTPCMGINYERARNAINLRIVSIVFFVIGAVLNATFSFIDVSQTAYILVIAISFLIYIFLANAIYNAKQ
jgi:hypothetical protein